LQEHELSSDRNKEADIQPPIFSAYGNKLNMLLLQVLLWSTFSNDNICTSVD